ncbi:hypothetical protein RCL10_06950 [Staphylococcus lloydii]|uniref:Uncharacterized protein n=1 Tax=Staphylococcus lloydii TaxID=2781774 RepID=A0A7T1F9X5_9STAP|nr:hypothetical protein [Staphylococcus lloydii]MDU9418240.1 hypothetical protein [Staphylococcus lloydii]QPM75765.1 hypothetical protein ISP08_03240 [Staphylococcus lloydii]
MAIFSNILLVIGIILLILMQLIPAIAMFVASLAISLVIFNALFRDKKGMRIAVNVSFILVIFVIVIAYKILT